MRAAGCRPCKSRIANESPSVNTDALWRGLKQQCGSCYRETFTTSSERRQCDGAVPPTPPPACSCSGVGGQLLDVGTPSSMILQLQAQQLLAGTQFSTLHPTRDTPAPHLLGTRCSSSTSQLGRKALLQLCVCVRPARGAAVHPHHPSPHAQGLPSHWDLPSSLPLAPPARILLFPPISG